MPTLITLLTLLLLSTPSYASHPRILFDQGHAQAFVIEKEGDLQLSKLARTFAEQGYEVSSTLHSLTPELLNRVDGLVISGAFQPFSTAEIAAVRQFIADGGRLTVMIHIGPPLLELLGALGVDVANGVIRENRQVIDGQPLNFMTSELRDHPLTQDLEYFSLYGSWPLRPLNDNGQTLAYSSDLSWVDLTGDKRQTPGDAVQAFGVLVESRIGDGELLVFGDDAIFQNRFLHGNNLRLAENLGRWLAAGKQQTAPAVKPSSYASAPDPIR